jgi:hypothetical protein
MKVVSQRAQSRRGQVVRPKARCVNVSVWFRVHKPQFHAAATASRSNRLSATTAGWLFATETPILRRVHRRFRFDTDGWRDRRAPAASKGNRRGSNLPHRHRPRHRTPVATPINRRHTGTTKTYGDAGEGCCPECSRRACTAPTCSRYGGEGMMHHGCSYRGSYRPCGHQWISVVQVPT